MKFEVRDHLGLTEIEGLLLFYHDYRHKLSCTHCVDLPCTRPNLLFLRGETTMTTGPVNAP